MLSVTSSATVSATARCCKQRRCHVGAERALCTVPRGEGVPLTGIFSKCRGVEIAVQNRIFANALRPVPSKREGSSSLHFLRPHRCPTWGGRTAQRSPPLPPTHAAAVDRRCPCFIAMWCTVHPLFHHPPASLCCPAANQASNIEKCGQFLDNTEASCCRRQQSSSAFWGTASMLAQAQLAPCTICAACLERRQEPAQAQARGCLLEASAGPPAVTPPAAPCRPLLPQAQTSCTDEEQLNSGTCPDSCKTYWQVWRPLRFWCSLSGAPPRARPLPPPS